MKKTVKSTVTAILTLVMAICMITGALAVVEPAFTKEELIEIEEGNKIIDSYMARKMSSRAVSVSRTLPMTPFMQQTTWSCPAATGVMVAKTLGKTYTEVQMRTIVNCIPNVGGSSEDWKNGFNGTVFPAIGITRSYQRVSMSQYSLWSSLVYSIDSGFPAVPTVKIMPNYTSSSGHFIAVNGYYWDVGGIEIVSYVDPHYDSRYFGAYSMTRAQMDTACSSNAGYYVRLAP